jgi:hypothetical protein
MFNRASELDLDANWISLTESQLAIVCCLLIKAEIYVTFLIEVSMTFLLQLLFVDRFELFSDSRHELCD